MLPIASIVLVMSAAISLFLGMDSFDMERRWAQRPGDKVITHICFVSAGLLAVAGMAGFGLWWAIDPTRWRTQIAALQPKIAAAKKVVQRLQAKNDAIPDAVVARWTDPQLRPILDSTP